MNVKRIFTGVFLLLLIQGTAFGWSNNVTHPAITNWAADFLLSENPCYTDLADHIHFNIATDAQLTFLDEGSVKEDYGAGPDWSEATWGDQQDGKVPLLSWWNHGYRPTDGESWDMFPDYKNAYLYLNDIWDDREASANKYFQLGRLCHLIEDMAAVPHANADIHADGDDLEYWAENYVNTVSWSASQVRHPSTDGLTAQAGLPHPTMHSDTRGDYLRNVAWRTYYMTTYYGGSLVETEGNVQPDSELKRMFPYISADNGYDAMWDGEYTGQGLHYNDGGFWGNNFYWASRGPVIVGYSWIGLGVGNNQDWWESPGDPGYYYLENIDGDYETSDPAAAGFSITPAVFKVNSFERITASTNLNTALAANTTPICQLYCERLFPMVVEWVAGFLENTLPAPPDGDGDGTPDCMDNCPADPGKVDPGTCGCGVADTDSDGDGTPDCIDNCPADPGKVDPGACGCGTPDTDSDGDGTPDCNDPCPADPDKVDPGTCGCGVADTDSDGDGTADCIDGCPADPAKTAPGTCGCGVADSDTDGDGTADCVDNCPVTWNPGQEDDDINGIGNACDVEASPLGTPDWTTQTSNTGDLLSGVWVAKGPEAFACGTGGRIQRLYGGTWSQMASNTTDDLSAIWGSSVTNIFAVGAGGRIQHYNGAWSQMSSNTVDNLRGVHGASATDVFAVGEGGRIQHYDGAWSQMASNTTADLNAVYAAAADDVFAVGAGGAIMHYDGTAWSSMASYTSNTLNAVWGSSGTDVYAVGDWGAIGHYDGTSWTKQASGLTRADLYGVFGVAGEVIVVGQLGWVLHYDGSAWGTMVSGTDKDLYAVWGATTSPYMNDLVAVGAEGTAIYYLLSDTPPCFIGTLLGR